MEEHTSHTPGPWAFDEICFERRIAIQGGKTVHGRPYAIAHVNRPASALAGQDKANARLIAAAPDLLKAAQDVHLRGDKASFRALEAAISRATQPQDEGEGR